MLGSFFVGRPDEEMSLCVIIVIGVGFLILGFVMIFA